jgi:NAD(P)-dependent dehydrogenase (short-subunit alcohol dehydrogenase family)
MRIDLADRVVLVTGGSRGIGAATVRGLAEAGARVLFTYRQAEGAARRLAAEIGEPADAVRCDFEDPAAPAAAVARCIERFGAIDVLVNNAAIFAENPFDGEDPAAWRAGWERTFAVNLFAPAELVWHALRAMRDRPPDARGTRGRIVNVASRAAHRGELTFADYGASKAALVNLTKSIARSCARDGIVAFSVAPGFIATEMASEAIARDGDAIRAEIPSGRVAEPDEVAATIVFLASGLADYATGSTIDLNGASYLR